MSNKNIKVGNTLVGHSQPCYIVAEIGINHNGSLDTAKELIDAAVSSGCNAIKFQKRTVEVVYSKEELSRPRENPFGETNGDLKKGLELGLDEYSAINKYCTEKGIAWFASCWDEKSVDFIEQFNPPCYKVASASLTDDNLLKYHRKFRKPIILSTGMSSMQEIEHAISVLGSENLIVLHSTSTYPAKLEELNLKMITTLKKKFPCPIGYSGHEVGLSTSLAAIILGGCMLERHITLDRSMWGSDHAASIEPQGLQRLVNDLRSCERALGDGIIQVYDSEIPIREKLRRI